MMEFLWVLILGDMLLIRKTREAAEAVVDKFISSGGTVLNFQLGFGYCSQPVEKSTTFNLRELIFCSVSDNEFFEVEASENLFGKTSHIINSNWADVRFTMKKKGV